MQNREELKKNWDKIIEIYTRTVDGGNPKTTADEIVEEIGYEDAVETFAAISKIKKYDGRIYGENRKWMDSIELTENVDERSHNNPLFNAGLDKIHTAHINNIITQLRKMKQ